jgi:fructose-specific component phosphotransferase system IIB-like protein
MPQPPDLTTFKPNSSNELFQGILGQVIGILGADWAKAEAELKADLHLLAQRAFQTQSLLAGGKISVTEADRELHFQEVFLNSALAHFEFMAYVTAQNVLDGVFGVIRAAIKNWTGIELNF